MSSQTEGVPANNDPYTGDTTKLYPGVRPGVSTRVLSTDSGQSPFDYPEQHPDAPYTDEDLLRRLFDQ